MKKRLVSALLAVVMTLTVLIVPAGAVETHQFSDVSDQNTATAVETLRLMGVLSGYSNGTFRPQGKLNRAQFCKMVTYALAAEGELGRYQTVTIFPDVKPSHWASSYINLASQGRHIIAGYPDGKFHPDKIVTVGQAVTILLRLLGYKDENIGGVWPNSYMATGNTVGLTKGVGTNGNAPLTRAMAAQLFLNLLQAKQAEGGMLYKLSEETELLSIDGGSGLMKTGDDKSYTMVHPVSSTSLIGTKGRVVLLDGKALTFLSTSSGSGGIANAAVIVYADRSSAGFSTLAGGDSYQIYKNGTKATIDDLRKYDVATYNADTHSILVSDTRANVYYESCDPSPTAPVKIQVLGGTELYVLPTARDSLAAFKPGQKITLLLTSDGQVAGAVKGDQSDARGNAIGVVDDSGAVKMLCGSAAINLAVTADKASYGQVVRIASNGKNQILLSPQSGGISGDLDITARKLGMTSLADNPAIFENGKQLRLNQLTIGIIPKSQIQYARTNWAGQVDLIVLDREANEIYGRVFWELEEIPQTDTDGNQTGTNYKERLGIEYGNGADQRTKTVLTHFDAKNGEYAAVKFNRTGTAFSSVIKLSKLANVSKSSWVGDNMVTFGGQTYTIPENVLCYNLDNKQWITREQAMAYTDVMNLYAKDGIIRIVEVFS